MIFEKTSTRTRCAFEVAGHDLGMGVTYLDPSGSQIGKKESIADTARVLGRMFDGIEYRGFAQEIVEELGKYAGVPVWNGLTNEAHPTQILADFLTMREHFGKLRRAEFCLYGRRPVQYGQFPDGGLRQNGGELHRLCAEKVFPGGEADRQCRGFAAESGAQLRFLEDPMEADAGADVIYTDVWVSMGEPVEIWAGAHCGSGALSGQPRADG